MKKFISKFPLTGAMVLLMLTVVLTPACHKDKPCKAVVTVVDATTAAPIVGATVELRPNGTGPNTQIQAVQESTDAAGKANFETSLPKIMDIYVNSVQTGKVVRFESGKTDEVTVKL